jgi:hypothetical protein
LLGYIGLGSREYITAGENISVTIGHLDGHNPTPRRQERRFRNKLESIMTLEENRSKY